MASGKTHDRSILFTAPILVGFFIQQGFSLRLIGIFALSYLFGGLMLSPDLDMKKSLPTQRYGILKFYWRPYQMIFKHQGWFMHRNPFTHLPIVGTVIRLLYFFLPFWLYFGFYRGLTLTHDQIIILAVFVAAVEIASLVHLFLDAWETYRIKK